MEGKYAVDVRNNLIMALQAYLVTDKCTAFGTQTPEVPCGRCKFCKGTAAIQAATGTLHLGGPR